MGKRVRRLRGAACRLEAGEVTGGGVLDGVKEASPGRGGLAAVDWWIGGVQRLQNSV